MQNLLACEPGALEMELLWPLSKNFFELVDCQCRLDECKQLQTGENEKKSNSLHMLHLTAPFNQSRSTAQSLQVVAAHICVKTTAETDSLHLYVVDLLKDVEPELTICQQRKSCPFVLFFSHVDPSSEL